MARNYDELVPMEDGMEEVLPEMVMEDAEVVRNIRQRLRPVMRVLRRDMDQQEIGVGISDDGFEGFASRYDNDLDSEPQVEERG